MAPFRFRLEQVRLYRKQLEEQAMQVMAQAVRRRDALRTRIAELEKECAAQRLLLSKADTLTPAELWLTRSYLDALREDADTAKSDLKKAEAYVDECRTALVERARERGLLDSLKEKQAGRHLQLDRQQEQRTNDETATLRFKPAAI